MTREQLKEWKLKIRPGDKVSFVVPYGDDRTAIVEDIITDWEQGIYVQSEASTPIRKVSKRVYWKHIIDIYTKKDNPEYFL